MDIAFTGVERIKIRIIEGEIPVEDGTGAATLPDG